MYPQPKNITEAAAASSQQLFHYSLSTRLLQDLCLHDIIAACPFPVQPKMRLVSFHSITAAPESKTHLNVCRDASNDD